MKKYILLAAVAFSLTACNTEDIDTDEPIAARISASIGESVLSRASDITWDKGDNIGISMSGRYHNIKYTTEDGDGKFVGTTMYFKNKVEPVTLTAYYPYTGTEGESPDIIEASTGVDRQTPAEQTKFDFLYGVKENVTGAEPNIKFALSHRMSKLTFIFKNGNKGTDVKKITSCEIDGLILEGTFNTVTGACGANNTTPSAIHMTPTVKNGEEHPSLSLLLFPQSVGNVTMQITDSDDQAYSCELFNGGQLESGNNYTYTITVKKTGLNIESISISNWTESALGTTASSK